MVTTTPKAVYHHTLHVLAAYPSQWSRTLTELQALWQTGDHLLLLADGASGWSDPQLTQFGSVGMLLSDSQELPLPNPLPTHLYCLDHAQWATLVVQYARCLVWR